jgi:hypothetical protein
LLATILSNSIKTAIRCRKSPMNWKMSIFHVLFYIIIQLYNSSTVIIKQPNQIEIESKCKRLFYFIIYVYSITRFVTYVLAFVQFTPLLSLVSLYLFIRAIHVLSFLLSYVPALNDVLFRLFLRLFPLRHWTHQPSAP